MKRFKRYPNNVLIEQMEKPILPTDYTSDEGPYIVSKPMTAEEIRIEIAKICGWTIPTEGYVKKPDGSVLSYTDSNGGFPLTLKDLLQEGCCIAYLPNYTQDLNAMHEAEKFIPLLKIERYWDELEKICRHRYFTEANIKVGPTCCISATAIQRAKAFLITFDLLK